MGTTGLGQQPVVTAGLVIGSPLVTCVPSQFELLPLRGAGGTREGLADLPAYVPRDFDDALRAAIVRAAEGTSVMVTLVSDFAAGKKRALWESLWWAGPAGGEPLLREWNVWPAASPSSPEALLDAAGMASPRTVLFLPGLDRYLQRPGREVGDRVARVLREMLGDIRRAPTLVLATLRTGHWQELRAHSLRFPHPKLLVDGSDIRVPDEFSAEEMARALISEDPRVAEAAARAEEDRYVIQHMLDVPDLQARVDTASALEGAILHCAIDARRLGHGRWLTRELLERGAGGYLALKVRHIGDEAGFDTAFAELRRRGPGGASVLADCDTIIVPGHEHRGSRCRLDDHLERQYVANATEPVRPEPHLWPVLVDTADAASLTPLAQECRRRGLLYWAMRFYLRAAEGGDRSARLDLADMLRHADRVDDALEQYRHLAGKGDQEAVILAAEMLIAVRRNSEAVDWLKNLTAQRHHKATVLTARAFEGLKCSGEALKLYRELAERGDVASAAAAADMMIGNADGTERAALIDQAVEWLMSLADRCGFETVELATELLVDDRQVDAAMSRLDDYAMTGRHHAYLLGAKILFSQGRTEEALSWCQTAVEYQVPHAATYAAKINAQLGLSEAAKQHAAAAAAKGNPEAFTEVGNVHAENGLTGRALECYRDAVDAGHDQALAAATEVAAAAGWSTDAAEFYRQAQRAKCAPPAARVAVALCKAGQVEDAFNWYFKNLVHAASPDILIPLTDFFLDPERELLLCKENVDLAVSSYAKVAKVAPQQAMSWLAEGLIRAGEAEVRAEANRYNGKIGVYAAPSQKLLAAAAVLSSVAAQGDVAARIRVVDLLLRLNQHVEAGSHLKTIEKDKSIDIDVDVSMTIALAGQGQISDATTRLRVQLDKKNAKAVASVAISLMRYKHDDDAVAFLERGAELGDIESHVRLGDHRRIKRRYTDALDLYLVALLHAHPEVSDRITTLFAATKDHRAQQDLRRYGITLAAQIAEPWAVADDASIHQLSAASEGSL